MLDAIYYSNEQGQTIRFTQYRSSNTDLKVDTEGATVQNTQLRCTFSRETRTCQYCLEGRISVSSYRRSR
ncbi:DUF4367 domain-containing protein [Desulfosporosinus metallidurans]|uniref:DUF4367 domain-containing protein n=1 Tax=Desulfosporosinus metallidurans TaxID=1888891 RepID=UPI0031F3E43C